MKKRFFVLLCLISFFVCMNVTESKAVDLPTSVTMPAGALGIHITKVIANCPFDGSTDTWQSSPTSLEALAFSQLKELTLLKFPPCPATDLGTKLGVFGPTDRDYFALDIAVSGGGFPSSVSVTTSMTSNPPVGDTFLGNKITATYTHVTFISGNDPLDTADDPDTVDDPTPFKVGPLSSGTTLGTADFTGHWTRIYVGVAIPHATAQFGDDPVTKLPPNVFPWTAGDPANSFSGSFQVNVAGFI